MGLSGRIPSATQTCGERPTTTFGNNHQNTRPDLVRTHSKKIKYEHFKANLGVEPTMTAKAKKTKVLLASDLKKIGKSWVEAKLIAR